MKRKSEAADFEADSGDRMTPGTTEPANSPFRTPVSGKTGKGGKSSRMTKCNRLGTQTPGSNIGEYHLPNIVLCILGLYVFFILNRFQKKIQVNNILVACQLTYTIKYFTCVSACKKFR